MVSDNYVRGININETQRRKWIGGETFYHSFLKCLLQLVQDTFHNHISKFLEDMSLKIKQAMMMMIMMIMIMIMIVIVIAVMLMMSTRKLAAL